MLLIPKQRAFDKTGEPIIQINLLYYSITLLPDLAYLAYLA